MLILLIIYKSGFFSYPLNIVIYKEIYMRKSTENVRCINSRKNKQHNFIN